MENSQLEFVGKEMDSFLSQKSVNRDVWKSGNIAEFSRRSKHALRLIVEEKEILLFSILQWVAIAIGYYFWVQIIEWIPMEVWESDSKIYDIPANLAVLLWSLVCVAAVAYPISILTAAMGAAHFLRRQGQQSTIAACLKAALPNSRRLWAFHSADAWITVDMIVERLPKRDRVLSAAERALKEALYYAWKVGTIAVPPALLAGKGLIEAGKESIELVKSKPLDVVRLRGGYSAMCWVIGVAAYVSSIIFFCTSPDLFNSDHEMFTFYLWMGIPILIAVGVIKLFVRPIYVIASCELYAEYLHEKGESVSFGVLPSQGTSAFVAFLVLCVFAVTVFLYRNELGLMSVLRVGG